MTDVRHGLQGLSKRIRQFPQVSRVLTQVSFAESCLAVSEKSRAGPFGIEPHVDVVAESPEDGDVDGVKGRGDGIGGFHFPAIEAGDNPGQPRDGLGGGHGQGDGAELGVGIVLRQVRPVLGEGVEPGSCHAYLGLDHD